MSSNRILLIVFSSGECWRNMAAKTVLREAKMDLWQGNSRRPMTKTTSLNFIPNSLYCWVDKSQCSCIASSGVVAAATGSFFHMRKNFKENIIESTNSLRQTCPKLQYHTQITIPRNRPWTGLSSNSYLESPGEKIMEHGFVLYFELQTDETDLQHSIRIPF